jgi:hypothetical protein
MPGTVVSMIHVTHSISTPVLLWPSAAEAGIRRECQDNAGSQAAASSRLAKDDETTG